LPARSLAQPRDSTRVVPAVPCCRSQPHCSSGSRGRDGKTAWALAAGCRWTPEASGRAAQRRARATGAPAPADRPALARGAPGPGQRRALLHARRRARSSLWREGDGSSGERPSFKGRAGQGRDADAAHCGPLSHLRHNAACELVSPDNSLRTYVGAASRPPP
ncbi:unnamed protein product, partial [Prorocentrum cordatum]